MLILLLAVLAAGIAPVENTSPKSSFSRSYQQWMNAAYHLNLAPYATVAGWEQDGDKHREIITDLAQFVLSHDTPVKYFHDLVLESNGRDLTLPFQAKNPQCQTDLTKLLLILYLQRPEWAFRFIDAIAKPPAGILDGNINWWGAFDECVNINVQTDTFTSVGTYCLVPIDLALKIGLCLPSSCGPDDIVSIIDAVNTFAHHNKYYNLTALNITTDADSIMCSNPNLPFTTYFYVAMTVSAILVVVNVLSTGYDIAKRVHAAYFSSALNSGNALEISASSNLFIPNNATSTAIQPAHQHQIIIDDEAPLVSDIDRPPSFPVSQQVISQSPSSSSNRTTSRRDEYLLSFSLLQNGAKLLSVDAPTSRGQHTLQVLHGIRLLSMWWVILSHTILLGANSGVDNIFSVLNLFKNLEFQVILHGFYAVDTFLVLGGFLLGYLTLRQLDKLDLTPGHRVGKVVKFFAKFYIHRWIRLTPTYALLLLVYMGIAPYFMYGPTWEQYPDPLCATNQNWWKNILYVHNLIDKDSLCAPWTWYLSVDFQLFLISPIPLLAFYWRPVAGWITTFSIVIASALSSGLIAAKYDLDGAPLSSLVSNHTGPVDILGFKEHFIGDYFVTPWCRAAPWAIGLAFGCALHRMPPSFANARLQNTATRAIIGVIGWTFSITTGLLCVYGMWPVYSGYYSLSPLVSQLYWAGSRVAWGLSITWVIYACIAGIFPGNLLRRFLSWSAFVPMSRLTYCAYLFHPIVMCTYFWTMRNPFHVYDMEIAYLFLASVFLVFSCVSIIAVGVEMPLSNLERLILDRHHHKD